jgi:hypothetical protein
MKRWRDGGKEGNAEKKAIGIYMSVRSATDPAGQRLAEAHRRSRDGLQKR